MRRILLLISTCVIASALNCGPETPECRVAYTEEIEIGKPSCWRLSKYAKTNEKEYCHLGKNVQITFTEYNEAAVVDCGGKNLDCSLLRTLNFTKNDQLKTLYLSNCSLNGSISCVLQALKVKKLTSLVLTNWGTEISAETVQGLDDLKNFRLRNSDAITKIPAEAFKQLPALHKIYMEGNNISEIPAQTFSKLGKLNITHLEISGPVKEDSGALQTNFPGIKTVDKDAFVGLPLVKYIVLNNNSIKELPASVFRHNPNLESLEIQDNRADLRLKNGIFNGLMKFNGLRITMYNGTKRLSLEDQSLSGLTSLTFCDLSKAGLLELPKDLFNGTKSLEELVLDNNELRLLPDNVFKDLVNLKKLSLSNNKLQDINRHHFSTAGKLETLNLARNGLENLSEKVFSGARSLKNLNLSYNQLNFECRFKIPTTDAFIKYIINLSESPLKTLQDLETLDLSHNNLTSICNDFLISTTLKELNLSHNQIPALTRDEINFLGNGTTIDLRYNQITSIPPRILDVTLLLDNNPYNCDCNNFKLLSNLKNLNYHMSEAICSEPKSLKGVPLISIAEARNPNSLDDLTCVLPDTPQNCECLARPSIKMIECACDEVVSNLPDPNDVSIHYLIDQNTTVTTKYNMLLKLKTKEKLENIPNFVTNLSLTNLTLITIPNIPEHIRYVDLTYNNLTGISNTLLSRNLRFSLSHNPFQCTCAGQSEIKNLQDYKDKINDYSSLKCHDGFEIDKIHVPRLCEVVISNVIAITIAVIGLLLVVLVVLVYKYQLEIRIWLYNQGWTFGLFNYENALDASKKYDIFLSYCHEDEAYIVNELLTFLDTKYKVCVHTRDFIPGDDIMTQIYRAVADSRRTVIVASKAYFESPWCLEEMRAAYKQTEVDQRIRAVVILRTDVDPKSEDISETVRSYLNLNTWIGEKDSRFWYRLCYFLPRDVTVEDLRLIRVTNEAKNNLSGQLNKVFVHDGKLGIDNETGEVNGNLVRNLCGVDKSDNIPVLRDEVKLATNNLPETLNVVHDDGKLVNVAVVKNDKA